MSEIEAIEGDVQEIGLVGEGSSGTRYSSNLYTLPSSIAMAHDRAQAQALYRINQAVHENNKTMRSHIYPLMHELAALLRGKDEDATHNLMDVLSHLDLKEINQLYQAYRKEFMEVMSDGAIQDGTLYDLFPEDLSEVSSHELKKIEGKLKEWLDHCKNFNNQKTQDLYLMIQIGVALLTAFQNMQKEMSQSGNYIVRNQRM